MKSKKAQGLSLHFIVIAAIAALILVLVVSFTVGGLGNFFSKMFSTGEEAIGDSDIDIAKTTCESLCDKAKQIDSPDEWSGEKYCTKTYNFDGTATHCWEAPISKTCKIMENDIYNENWECNEDTCGGCLKTSCNGDYTTEDNITESCSGFSYTKCGKTEGCSWEQ